MTTPSYVAKRVGDEFVLMRVDTPGLFLRIGTIAAGALLVKKSLTGHGLLSAAGAVIGSGLIYQGWTGRDPLKLLSNLTSGAAGGGRGPSHQNDFRSTATQTPADAVEEAQMESFPASDAPARSGTASA